MTKDSFTDDEIDKIIERLGTVRKNIRHTLVKVHNRIESVLPSVKDASRRGELQHGLWECLVGLGLRPGYFSHCGEDWWLDEHVFKGQRGGTFVDLGGYDGVHGSNTLFFELMHGWNGLLLEPSPKPYDKAASFRRCHCLKLAVAKAAGEARFLEVSDGYTMMSGLVESFHAEVRAHLADHPSHKQAEITVRTTTLDSLLRSHGLRKIDFISMDIEGAELQVLEGFPFDSYDVRAWIIENRQRNEIIAGIMRKNGYKRANMLGGDDIYLKENDAPEFPDL